MAKIIEGLWDCNYCGRKAIGGLTKSCPSCGHKQDNDTKFYLGEKRDYLDDKTAQNYGKGEDWVCAFCNSLNRYNVTVCSGCGGDRTESEETYFHKKSKSSSENKSVPLMKPTFPKEQNHSQPRENVPLMVPTFFNAKDPANPKYRTPENQNSDNTSKKRFNPNGLLFKIVCIILGIVLLGTSLFLIFKPKTVDATVSDKTWSRSIAVEEYKTVKENDWSVPTGGRTYRTAKEIHHHDQVLDHYESHQEQRSRQVPDGYDEQIVHHNNGDGTFSESVIRTPRYRTEYYYETVQTPVYKDVPVYKTKYYYEIDKWVHTRDIKTSGHFDKPEWGEIVLKEKERTGSKTESYELIFKTDKKQYKKKVKENLWSTFSKGDNVSLTIQTGIVTKINNQEV